MPSRLPFLLSTASVLGQGHREEARNNQDAVAFRAERELLVGVVADGCSASPRSEVGAALGARWLAEWLPTFAAYEKDPVALVKQAREGLLGYLTSVIDGLRPHREERVESVQELFLFTVLAVLVDDERALAFGLGDGLAAVNGEVTLLEAGPDGAPPYITYELIRPHLARDPGPLIPTIVHAGPSDAIDSMLVATDGVVDLLPTDDDREPDLLSPLWLAPEYATDPHALAVHLAAHGERLFDDTTIALIRRKP